MHTVQLIGHRGARGLEPENTQRSFLKAMEIGVDYVECDVRLTRDNAIVLMHDATVDRTTDGTGPVRAFTFDEIRQLDAGQGERVPTLEELLDLARGRVGLHIEMKDGEALDQVVEQVRSYAMTDAVCLTSGQTETVARIRTMAPEIAAEHIFGNPPPDAIDRACQAGAARVSCHIDYLTEAYVEHAHKRGLIAIAWPPNTPDEIRAALDTGVDMICSDRPDIAVDVLRRFCRSDG